MQYIKIWNFFAVLKTLLWDEKTSYRQEVLPTTYLTDDFYLKYVKNSQNNNEK